MASKEAILERTNRNAEENGFFVCPDDELLGNLLAGLTKNENRYGYASCPCRVASGVKSNDVDIICPCEYRDADVNEFGMCYCGLYVSKEVKEDKSKMRSIPERRPQAIIDAAFEAKRLRIQGKLPKDETGGAEEPGQKQEHVKVGVDKKGIPIWRCKVCGYLCARELPPPICPICKAKADKFEKFGFG